MTSLRPDNSVDLSHPRIYLRAVEPADASLLYGVENDTDAWGSADTVAPYSMFALQRYAETCSADPFADGQLRMIAAISGRPEEAVGILDFYEITAIHSHAWIGIYILPAFRGKGYAHEIISLAIGFARQRLRLDNLGARILVSKTTSLHLFEGCGFSLRGTLPSWRFAEGSMQDLHILTITIA